MDVSSVLEMVVSSGMGISVGVCCLAGKVPIAIARRTVRAVAAFRCDFG